MCVFGGGWGGWAGVHVCLCVGVCVCRGEKRGDLMFCGSAYWGNLSRLDNFFLMSCKNNLPIFIWSHVWNINSLAVAVS